MNMLIAIQLILFCCEQKSFLNRRIYCVITNLAFEQTRNTMTDKLENKSMCLSRWTTVY